MNLLTITLISPVGLNKQKEIPYCAYNQSTPQI